MIDIPDDLFRRTKSFAASQGISLKQLVIRAVEREINLARPDRRRYPLPLIHLEPGHTLDMTNYDFDDLLV